MGVPQHRPLIIGCDNRSTIQITHNDIFHEQTKHIEIDCHFVRQHVAGNAVHLLSITSEEQPADLFIKVHSPGRFQDLISKLKMVSNLQL